MKKAVCTGLAFVNHHCHPGFFRSVWDRLCRQLFGPIPPGMDTETILPNVQIWEGGIVKLTDTEPFSFSVASDGEEVPHAYDIIQYKGQYYVIGAVEE